MWKANIREKNEEIKEERSLNNTDTDVLGKDLKDPIPFLFVCFLNLYGSKGMFYVE